MRLWLVIFLVAVNTQMAKAEDYVTVEGIWEVQSSWDADSIGNRYSIVRKGDGYKSSYLGKADSPLAKPEESQYLYYGAPTQVTRSMTLSYETLQEIYIVTDETFRKVLEELGGKLVQNSRITVSPDGRTAERAEDNIRISCDPQTGRLQGTSTQPFFYKSTWKRISGPIQQQVEDRGDHAYQADCSNPKQMCPGNLVTMTYFCGGNTDCSYVCCPKGLPYLNHCDCKCYATADFDCHSYSTAQEQPGQ